MKTAAASLALMATCLTGCIAVGGPDKTLPPTLGQELMDLRTAYEKEAITADEYEEVRKRMLANGPRVARY